MDKRVILAVAGSGKTYTLCNGVDPLKRNLIVAYTNQNVKNIRKELFSKYKEIPKNTKIYTFHSFIYNFFIRPYEPIIAKHFLVKIKSNGVSLKEPPPQRINNKPNYKYIKDIDYRHYYYGNKVYCSRMSKLIVKTKKNKCYDLIKTGMKNINKFFDNIYIDEFQDFREYDSELLDKIIKVANNILLVGDYYQHSVSAINNTGKPFKIRDVLISYQEYISNLQLQGLEVDNKSLLGSRRCSKDICQFIQKKLHVNIVSSEINIGKVIFCKDLSEIKLILDNDSIVKLLNAYSNSYYFNSLNWSCSKGDTFNDVCVILTGDFENIDLETFSCNGMSQITLNKLYVALSRSKGDLYIIKKSDFDQIKEKYKINKKEMI